MATSPTEQRGQDLQLGISTEADRLRDLADRISRTEPDPPSIQTPLAHEAEILKTVDQSGTDEKRGRQDPEISAGHETEPASHTNGRAAEPRPWAETSPEGRLEDTNRIDELDLRLHYPESDFATSPHINEETQETPARKWPVRPDRDPHTPEHPVGRLDGDQTLGWEP